METWQIATIVLTAAGLAFTVIWNLAGKPEPLKPANVRRPLNWVRRKRDARAAVRAERKAERLEQQEQLQVVELREQFVSAALRLCCILHSGDQYHSVELNRQRRLCEELAIRHEAANGTRLSQRYLHSWCRLERSERGTLLTSFHTNPPIEERLWVAVRWHPDPEFSGSEADEAWGELETLLAEPLEDRVLPDVGWERPNSYLNDWALDSPPFEDRRFKPELDGVNREILSASATQTQE